jgi:DNA-binding NarL/FixJ family response regulator
MGPVEKSRPLRIGVLPTAPLRVVGFAAILEGAAEFRPVFAELEVFLADLSTTLLLIDIHEVPDATGVLARLRGLRPDIRTILIGPPAEDSRVTALIAGGAKAYLEERVPAKQILEAIHVVAEGSIWAPRRLLAALIDRLLDRASEPIRGVSAQLTEREQQVLLQIMAARSNREIADSLGIEERTVKSYVAKLMKKTGAENRIALSMHSLAQVLVAQKNEEAVRETARKGRLSLPKDIDLK